MWKLGLIIISLVGLMACTNEETQIEEVQLRPVKTFIVGSASGQSRRSFPGVVDANQKAELSFRVSGKLNGVNVKEGDFVKKGQLLATIDDADFKIELQEAKASYSKAKADLDRGKLLVEKGHVSKADFDKITAAEVSAKAHLDTVQQKITYAKLEAPFSGQIAKRYIENFQEVGASQTIFLIQDLSQFEVSVDLPASVMVNAERDRSNIKIFATFEAIANQQFPLTIKEVSTVPDEVTQTYSVKLNMDNIDGYTILPGMTATVSANNPEVASDSLFVPSHTVLGTGEQAYVWVVDDNNDGTGVVRKQTIAVGELTEHGFAVLSGLTAGQAIVAAGVSKVTDGLAVRLKKD